MFALMGQSSFEKGSETCIVHIVLSFITYSMKKLLIAMTFILWLFAFASADKVDDAISWMYDNGLTIHNNKTDFNATRWLRRDEAAKFYVNFAKLLGKTTYVKTSSQCVFSDINSSWSDLKDIVVESCRLWLFQWSKWKFNPTSQLTNAQAITVLVRLLAWNQSEIWLSHRADNYYTKANELAILQFVNMDSKDSIATRGNVGIIIWNGNNLQWGTINMAWNRYNSSLWFSIMLPWECSDWTSQWWYENVVYHWIENLNYWTNNDKRIECFMPDQNNTQDILELNIQGYPCDNEQNGQQVIIWSQTFTMYTGYSPPELWGAWDSKCYKTTYNNQTIRFNFIRWYDNNIIQEMLESLNNPI